MAVAVVDAQGDELEDPYSVPTHLETSESISFIPKRLFAYGLLWFAISSLIMPAIRPAQMSWQWWLIMAGPGVLGLPFAIWWLRPGPEHGLMVGLRHLFRPKLLDPDRLKSYQRMRIADGVVYIGEGEHCLTIWRLPSKNLDVASPAARRRHRAQWGTFLDALGHRVTIVIRAKRLERLPAIYEVFEHGAPEAKALAHWLRTHIGDRPLVSRERYMVIPAPDPDTLRSRCDDVRRSMAQFDWRPAEPESDRELELLLNDFWPKRPDSERLGPSVVERKWRESIVDGEYTRTFAMGSFPPVILTDWWSHLTDGDLSVDLALDLEPRDIAQAKRRLSAREIGLSTSRPSRERDVALEQIRNLAMALERSFVKPWGVSLTLGIRANTRPELDALERRLRQRIRDRGNPKLQRLIWEQWDGSERIAPLGHLPLPNRVLAFETGTLARTTPLASSTMQLEGGVILGEAGQSPCLFWTRAGQKNQHMAVYGGSGAGKGYLVKVYLARQFFQHDVSIWGIDSDEQHEYAGRFCDYLHGTSPVIREADDVDRVPISRFSKVVIWDLSECPDSEYGPAVVKIADRLIAYVEQHGAPTDFFVDEAVNVLRDATATSRVNDLVQRGRHWGIGMLLITQLVSDWSGSHLGRRVHGLVDSWWCGQQNPAEVDAIASLLRLTPEEKTKVEGAAQGRGLLATFNGSRRVWLDLYEKASPEEHAMAHTTPRTLFNQRRRVRYLEQRMNDGFATAAD